jgi:hypothetical protein
MGKKELQPTAMLICADRIADNDGLASQSKKTLLGTASRQGFSLFASTTKFEVLKTDAHVLKRFVG